ncbi:hypothetical protein ACV07N_15710 [Roseivirga echinicomitans]
MAISKNSVIDQFGNEKREIFLKHFNEIYEVKELSSHEENMIYLAWLIKNKYLSISTNTSPVYDPSVIEFDIEQYEITIESEPGLFNFDILYNFYAMGKLQELL